MLNTVSAITNLSFYPQPLNAVLHHERLAKLLVPLLLHINTEAKVEVKKRQSQPTQSTQRPNDLIKPSLLPATSTFRPRRPDAPTHIFSSSAPPPPSPPINNVLLACDVYVAGRSFIL